MSYISFRNNSNCIGGRQYFPTTNIKGEFSSNKKQQVKLIFGTCSTRLKNQTLLLIKQLLQNFYLVKFRKISEVLQGLKLLPKR